MSYLVPGMLRIPETCQHRLISNWWLLFWHRTVTAATDAWGTTIIDFAGTPATYLTARDSGELEMAVSCCTMNAVTFQFRGRLVHHLLITTIPDTIL